MLRVVALLLAALAASVSAASGGSNCGTAGYEASISTVTLSPLQPIKGQPATLNATGTLNAAITGGAATLTVQLEGVNLFSHAANTCGATTINFPLNFGSATINGIACPASAGASIAPGMSIVLPAAAPSGQYTVKIDSQDTTSKEVFCIQADFTL
ncbi:hypothetical protein FNF29_06905 [Cafeteria roenbergensis]|uniref:MD-2-related lipid-recognition domain-containing protein n=1 Tax=Cafeteria roenbergensis TaxID=33653 RepID=A0A5A8C7S3_CAFRO|nr:hypothetical protein FNF29_06905 [Cafeteria roenbergensis]|eukprot:KAA0148110.1 hypothetical protein FNF29_06905 [Cafeteria roenbergensis]